jgi:hypothetical protein
MDTGSTTFWADPPSRQLMGARCLEGSHDNSLAWDRKIDGTTLYADSLSFGGVTVTTPIVRTSSSRDGAILGWTSLAVLHRVLFDLDGSSIQFEKPTGQLSGIQPWAYAQGLATDSHGNLISGNSPAGDVPGSTPPEGVSSIDGIGVDRLFRGAETPWNERALDMQSAVESWKGEPQFILQGGKHVGLSVLGPDFRYGPGKLLPAGQGDDNSDDLFADGPGTYFWKPGARPVRCWAGTLTLPAGETWTVQSVGGVPQPKPGASGAYEIPDTSWLWPHHVLDSSASAFLAAGGEPYVPPLYAGVQRTYHRDGSVTDAFSSGAVLTWLLPRSDRYGSAVKLGQLPVLCLHDAKGEVKTPAGSTYSPLPGGGGWLLPRGWTLGSDEAPAPPAK